MTTPFALLSTPAPPILPTGWSVLSALFIFLAGLALAMKLAVALRRSVAIGIGLYLWHALFCLVYSWYVVGFGGDAIYYFHRAATGGNDLGLGTPMVDLLAELVIASTGTSFVGVSLAFHLPGSIGLLLLYDVLSTVADGSETSARSLVLPVTLLPSASFWTSGLGKDGIAFLAVSLMTWAVVQPTSRRPALALSVGIMMLVRPHIAALMLVALLVGALGEPDSSGIQRVAHAVAIGAIVIGILPAIVGFLGLSDADGLDDVGNYVEQRQQYNQAGEAGVNISELPAPLQVATYLFRPLPHEAWSVFALVASIEVVFLLAVAAVAIHAKTLGGVAALRGQSLVLWVYAAGGAYTLATTTANMGIALRQKWMLMPAILVLLLSSIARRRSGTPTLAPLRTLGARNGSLAPTISGRPSLGAARTR